MKKSTSQTGSAHLVIIVIIVLAVLGALGYVLWSNLNKPKASTTAQTSQNNSAPAKKSEIIALQNSDMNKYVNYEQGFEFEFPKAIYSGVSCTTSTTVTNTAGQQIPVELHYNFADGSADTTVLEGTGRYVIVPKSMVVLSNYTQTSDGHPIARACGVEATTMALVDTRNEVDGATYVDNTATKEFDIIAAKSDDDITAFIRKTTGDNQATIGTKGQLTDGRQDVSIKYGPERLTGTGGYKLWYYPTQQKLVYFSLGQAPALFDPAHYNTNPSVVYDMDVVNSFKFATN